MSVYFSAKGRRGERPPHKEREGKNRHVCLDPEKKKEGDANASST